MDREKRYIKLFKKDLEIDASVIEILPEDNISEDYFLKPDYFFTNNFHELEGKEIIILQYPSERF